MDLEINSTDFLTVIGPAFAWFGIQIAWSVLDAFATPYLLELGLTTSNVNYVWLGGPISGILVQPIIGSMSDLVKKRKPFIAIASMSTVIALLLFSNSKEIGQIVGSSKFALIFGICMCWLLDCSINVIMAPTRALAADSVHATKQIYSMSWFATFAGFAHIIAFLLGAITPNIVVVYAISSVLIFISCVATLIIVRSEDNINRPYILDNNDNNNNKNALYVFKNICIGLYKLPLFMWKLMNQSFWTFVAFDAMWIYMTDFYGENIMKGDVHANEGSDEYQLYQLGVQYGNLGYTLQGVIILIVAYFLPFLANKFGLKRVWIFCMMVCSICLCLLVWVDNLYGVIALHAVSGMGFASFMVCPWTIANQYTCTHDVANSGLTLTILNLAICVPQLFVSFIGGVVIDSFNHNVSSMLFVGGCGGFIAALSILWVETKYKPKYEHVVDVESDQHEKLSNNSNDIDNENEVIEIQQHNL